MLSGNLPFETRANEEWEASPEKSACRRYSLAFDASSTIMADSLVGLVFLLTSLSPGSCGLDALFLSFDRFPD
jgi:hypothetical protein